MALSPQERSRRMRLNMLMAMSYAVAGRSAFTPLSLFSAGEVGAWYDPSDFSTMFQDSAGTTPVTAVEQPVGLIRDKSGRGNHASQTTSTSRPVLSARVNLLTYSEQFNNAAWTKSNLTASEDTFTDANSGVAILMRCYVGNVAVFGTSNIFSVELKAGTRSAAFVGIEDGGIATNRVKVNLSNGTLLFTGASVTSANVASIGGGWYRVSIALSPAADTSANKSAIIGFCDNTTTSTVTTTGDGTGTILVRKADLRPSNQANLPAYQRIAAATDYDTTGFPYYLSFDGTDDSLATAAIDFSATNAMTVHAGVRKLSDATTFAVIAELSAAWSSNNGTFILCHTGGSANTIYGGSRGAGPAGGTATPSGFTPPVSIVTTLSAAIATDQLTMRANGVQVGTSSADQGTGNYGNHVLYIGRRAGTSLSANMRLYSLIARGKASTDTEITNAETWVNSKTKAF